MLLYSNTAAGSPGIVQRVEAARASVADMGPLAAANMDLQRLIDAVRDFYRLRQEAGFGGMMADGQPIEIPDLATGSGRAGSAQQRFELFLRWLRSEGVVAEGARVTGFGEDILAGILQRTTFSLGDIVAQQGAAAFDVESERLARAQPPPSQPVVPRPVEQPAETAPATERMAAVPGRVESDELRQWPAYESARLLGEHMARRARETAARPETEIPPSVRPAQLAAAPGVVEQPMAAPSVRQAARPSAPVVATPATAAARVERRAAPAAPEVGAAWAERAVPDIQVSQEPEQARLMQLAQGAIAMVDALLGTIPAGLPEAERLRARLSSRRDELQRYVRENDSGLDAAIVLNTYVLLSREVDTASNIISIWGAMSAEERRDTGRSGSVAYAIRTLTDFDFNPFAGMEEREVQSLATRYLGGVSRVATLEELRTELQRRRAEVGETSRSLPVPRQLRADIDALLEEIDAALSAPGGPAAGRASELATRGNMLIMQADLCRSREFRLDASLYRAYAGLIPDEFQETRLAGDAAERAVAGIAAVSAARSRIRYMHDLVAIEDPSVMLFGSGGSPTRREITLTDGSTEQLELYPATGALQLLDDAVSSCHRSGMAADDPAMQAAQRLLEHLRGLEAGSMSADELMANSERAYHAAVGLLAIREAQLWIDNRASLSPRTAEDGARAQAALDSARTWYINDFGNPGADYPLYPALAEMRAYAAIDAVAPPAFGVLGPAGLVRDRYALSGNNESVTDFVAYPMDIRSAADRVQAALDEGEDAGPARGLLGEVRDDFSGRDYGRASEAQERFAREHIRTLVRLGRDRPAFGSDSIAVQSELLSGFLPSDALLDVRFGRIMGRNEGEYADMEERRAVRPTEDFIDTFFNPSHRRVLDAVVSGAGFVFQEVDRQVLMARDGNVPAVLRQSGEELGIEGFRQLDLTSLQADLSELSEAYGTSRSYQEMAHLGNSVLMRVLDGRIEQLEVLLGRIRRRPDSETDRWRYDIATAALDEARGLRAQFRDAMAGDSRTQAADLFRPSVADADPLEAIAIAEHGAVHAWRITPPEPERARPGIAIAIEGAGSDRAGVEMHRITVTDATLPMEDGSRISLDQYRERFGRFPVFHFVLFERLSGDRIMLVNPEFIEAWGEAERARRRGETPSGTMPPRYIGTVEMSDQPEIGGGTVYRVIQRGGQWIRQTGEGAAMFQVYANLDIIPNEQFGRIEQGENPPFFEGANNRVVVPGGGGTPVAVGYVHRHLRGGGEQ